MTAGGNSRVSAPDHEWQARDHLSGFFSVLDGAIRDGADALSAAQGEVSGIEAGRLVVADRGVTILQAARLLLKENHWEAASGVARQLFELLVNIEYLTSQSDAEAAWASYKSFGLMAMARGYQRQLTYAASLGYQDASGTLDALDKFLAPGNFDEFRDKKQRLLGAWSRRDVSQLAEVSANPARKGQYDFYYRTWSEQTHTAPSALLRAMLPQDADGCIERIMDQVLRETRQLIVILISLFADLIGALGTPALVPDSKIESWRHGLAVASKEWQRPPAGQSANSPQDSQPRPFAANAGQ